MCDRNIYYTLLNKHKKFVFMAEIYNLLTFIGSREESKLLN